MGHLHKYGSLDRIIGRAHAQLHSRRIAQYEAQNSMSIGNIAIVFGPTLFPATAPHGVNGQDGLVGATIQNKVCQFRFDPEKSFLRCWLYFQAIETILEHYTDIFVDESEDS